jgi:hypothetical protein
MRVRTKTRRRALLTCAAGGALAASHGAMIPPLAPLLAQATGGITRTTPADAASPAPVAFPDLAPHLLEAAPGVLPDFERLDHDEIHAHHMEWRVVAFAYHLARLDAQGQTDDFPAAFATVERLLEVGDDVVQRHMGCFFFCMFLTAAEHESVPLDGIERWFGPRTQRKWDEAHDFRDWIRRVLVPQYDALSAESSADDCE